MITTKLKRDEIFKKFSFNYCRQSSNNSWYPFSGVLIKILDLNQLTVFIPRVDHLLTFVGIHKVHMNIQPVMLLFWM